MKRGERIVGFARVSSREQMQEGYSLEVQEAAIRGFAGKHGAHLVRLFKVPESAKDSRDREEFHKAIAFASDAKNQIDRIVFHRSDRAVRSVQDVANLEVLQTAHGVSAFMIQEQLDTAQSSGEFVFSMLASVARLTIRQMSEKIKDSVEHRVFTLGLFPGKAPWGYANERRSGAGIIDVHEVNGPNILRMFEIFAAERLTVDLLRERLFSEGIFYSPASPKFSRAYLYKILRNRSYIGEVKYRGEWHPCGSFVRLVPRNLFDEVQARLGDRRHSQADDLPFSGNLIQCGVCGRAITGELKKQKYSYYRCSGYTKSEHPRVRVTGSDLDEQVLSLFDSLRTEDEELRAWLVGLLRENAKDAQERGRERRRSLKRRLTTIENRLDQLLQLRLAEEVDAASYQRAEESLRTESADLMRTLDAEAEVQHEGAEAAIEVFELAQHLRTRWLSASNAAKRRILTALALNWTLDGKILVPALRMPFQMLADGLLHASAEDGRGERI